MPDFIIVKRKRKDYEQYTCRIEVELLEKLKTIVYENNLDSVNELVNKSIKFALENMKIKMKVWLVKSILIKRKRMIRNSIEFFT